MYITVWTGRTHRHASAPLVFPESDYYSATNQPTTSFTRSLKKVISEFGLGLLTVTERGPKDYSISNRENMGTRGQCAGPDGEETSFTEAQPCWQKRAGSRST